MDGRWPTVSLAPFCFSLIPKNTATPMATTCTADGPGQQGELARPRAGVGGAGRTATMATTMMPALPPPSSGGGGGTTTGTAQPLKVYGPEVLHTAAAAVPW